MAILQLSPIKIGQTGVRPATYKLVSDDALSAITTPGYLKQGTGGQFFQKNDLVEGLAAFGTNVVENVVLYVTIDANGVITLNEDLPEGLGQAALKNVTDNAQPLVVSVSGATQVNHIAKFDDVNGTITDGGILGTAANKATSDNSLASVAAVSGVTVIGNLASFQSISGTVQDTGFAAANVQNKTLIHAGLDTNGIGGGGAGPYTVAAPVTAASLVVACLQVSTNPVSVVKCVPGLNEFDVTFSADPGADSQLAWIAIVEAQ